MVWYGVLMIIGWMLLVAVAITAARYLRNHWSNRMPFGLKIWFHIGAIAIILMIAQPLGSFLRCDQSSKYRPVFNWSHRISGLLSFILSQVCILLAVIYFKVWIARWAAAVAFAVYLIFILVLIISAQKINSLSRQQQSSVAYGSNGHYNGEQVTITKNEHDSTAKKMMVSLILAFTLIIALIVVLLKGQVKMPNVLQ
ncbi:unnamed protein product [Thelazia callipaeda]|uniref:Cytochrome b561 domain-containing protein n=1 Tax=Thelazia callipaeda TaxID=103827 RepID=A0A0N5D6D3_THECL|nr:unnamed protein product [Thelazia callipaeda]